MRDQDARGWYVYRTLREHAARTQAPILAQLRRAACRYRSFWAANVVMTEGDRSLVDDARRTHRREGDRVGRQVRLDPGRTPQTRRSRADDTSSGASTTSTPRRSGRPASPARASSSRARTPASGGRTARSRTQYRGWNGTTADHNYNWHDADPRRRRRLRPQHASSRATTTATARTRPARWWADDGGANQVGVAPGAKWIGCRNMDQGVGSPATYTECFQWFIAPTDSRAARTPTRPSGRTSSTTAGAARRARAAPRTRCRRSCRTPRPPASSSRPRPETAARAAARSRDPPAIYSDGLLDGRRRQQQHASPASAAAAL